MPRQRKPQSGVARAAGRVANTTTSWRDIAVTNAKVYRIPTGVNRPECPAPLIEVGWVSPISVRKEWNVYYVSLPVENIKSIIEGMDNLDLSNVAVSLETVNGPLTISWNITSDGTIIGEEVVAENITAATWTIETLASTDATITNLKGNVTVEWTPTFQGNINVNWNANIGWTTTIGTQLTLWENATAPQFVLQTEKGQAGWVATLDENWLVPWDQLPVEIPRLYFSIWYWVFRNSDTCVIEDSRIHLNSYVNISNYDDIEWDLHEVVWDWWLTVTSNTAETGTFRYLVVTPDVAYSNVNVPERP